jgi:hypothetical protein
MSRPTLDFVIAFWIMTVCVFHIVNFTILYVMCEQLIHEQNLEKRC